MSFDWLGLIPNLLCFESCIAVYMYRHYAFHGVYLLADTLVVFEINSICCTIAIILVKLIPVPVGARDKFCLTIGFGVDGMSDGLIGK